MNYAAHYERLIGRARLRTISGFCEKHHVIPRCMGGNDAPRNLVKLTGAEHFVAHLLLIRMFPNEPKLVMAACIMRRRCTNNKSYEWLRKKHSAATSKAWSGVKRGPLSEERKAKLSEQFRGRFFSIETRAKISAANKGRTSYRKGVPLTEAHKAAVGAANKGRIPTTQQRARMSEAQRRKPPVTNETRKKQSLAQKGRVFSIEHRAKLSANKKAFYAGLRAVSV